VNTPINRVHRKEEQGFLLESNSGEQFRARVVVNTAGAWLRRIEVDFPLPELRLFWAKAFNLELSQLLEPRYGIGLESSAGRAFFLTPRRDDEGDEFTTAGTWYRPFEESPDCCEVTDEEVQQAIDELNTALPSPLLTTSDVRRVERGVLPAYALSGGEPLLYGASKILDSGGYLEVLSTKYTTFQSQGRKVLKVSRKYLGER
jgi:glycerol-3-phosphate dehydrogenase